jgi:chromosome segregation ATPase
MAITKEQVFDAADSLEQMGTEPTYLHVRMHLGSGSFSTIQKYLRQWKEARGDSSTLSPESDVPEVLLSAARGFAKDAWRVAQSAIARRTAALREELEQQNASALQDAEAASRMVDTLQAKLEEVRAQQLITADETAALREQIVDSDRRRIAAETALDSMSREHNRKERLLEQLQSELTEKTQALMSAQSTISNHQLSIAGLEQECSRLREERDRDRSRMDEQDHLVNDLVADREARHREVTVLKEQLMTERSRYDSLSTQLNRLSELLTASSNAAASVS